MHRGYVKLCFLLAALDSRHLNYTSITFLFRQLKLILVLKFLQTSKENHQQRNRESNGLCNVFFFLRLCLCMHVSSRGGRDLLGDIVTLTPGWLLSDALASDPVHCGREGLSLRAAGADKLGLEVILGASGLPGESWSSAESQVSFQQVFLVLTSRVSYYTYELIRRFLQIKRDLIWFWFSLTQLIFTLNGES